MRGIHGSTVLSERQLVRNRLGRRALFVVGLVSGVVYVASLVPAFALAMSAVGAWLVPVAIAVLLACFLSGAYGDIGDVTNRITARLAPRSRADRDRRLRLRTPIGTYVREDGRFVRVVPANDYAPFGRPVQVVASVVLIVSFIVNLLLARGAPEAVGDGYVIYVKGVAKPVSYSTYLIAEGAIARLWATVAIVIALEGWYRLRRLDGRERSTQSADGGTAES